MINDEENGKLRNWPQNVKRHTQPWSIQNYTPGIFRVKFCEMLGLYRARAYTVYENQQIFALSISIYHDIFEWHMIKLIWYDQTNIANLAPEIGSGKI